MSSKKNIIQTRSDTEHSIFGQSCEFPENQLPTRAEVFKHYLYIRHTKKNYQTVEPSIRDVNKSVSDDLQNVWSANDFIQQHFEKLAYIGG